MTYSIVARDPDSGQMGVAVQSHWFSVGSVVTWGAAEVGVVATQANAEVMHGPRGVEFMREGASAADALARTLAIDEQAEFRQVAMVDARGGVAAHTGTNCIAEAGHAIGEQFSAQANMMFKNTVWDAMRTAFEKADGDLTERLLRALEAAEDEGGDIRGKQSAAILVVAAEATGHPSRDTVVELRVEDHPEPLTELRRLVSVGRAYNAMGLGDVALAEGDTEGASKLFAEAHAVLGTNPEAAFWSGLTLASAGQLDEGRSLISIAFDVDERWRELLRRLPASGLADEKIVEELLR